MSNIATLCLASNVRYSCFSQNPLAWSSNPACFTATLSSFTDIERYGAALSSTSGSSDEEDDDDDGGDEDGGDEDGNDDGGDGDEDTLDAFILDLVFSSNSCLHSS